MIVIVATAGAKRKGRYTIDLSFFSFGVCRTVFLQHHDRNSRACIFVFFEIENVVPYLGVGGARVSCAQLLSFKPTDVACLMIVPLGTP